MQGLEIPCKVTVEMETTDKNSLAIDKYRLCLISTKSLLKEHFQMLLNRY